MIDRDIQRMSATVNSNEPVRRAMLFILDKLASKHAEDLERAKTALVMSDSARPKALLEQGALNALLEVRKIIEDYSNGSSNDK